MTDPGGISRSHRIPPVRAGWIALLLAGGLAAAPVGDPHAPVDDRALSVALQEAADRLAPVGGTLTNWQGQLAPRTASRRLPRASRRSRTAENVARRASESVFVVGAFHLCDRCHRLHPNTATGFVVTEDGVLVTSRHVLASIESNGRALVALGRDGTVYPVRSVVASDSVHDLVALQLEGDRFEPLALADTAAPGGRVHVLSHPEGRYFTFTQGEVSRRFLDSRGDPPVEWFSITADFAKGSSGAPVLDGSGNAVGVVNNTQSVYYRVEDGRQENLQMVVHNCIPASAVQNLLTGR